MTLLLRGGTIVDRAGRNDVLIVAGRVAAIGENVGEDVGGADRVLDADGLVLAPGFVDLQCNGGFGLDLTARPEAVWELGARLPEYGVTSWLPTVISSPAATTDRAIDVLAAGPPTGWRGAAAIGWHFEGPMLNPRRKGAHPEPHLRAPSPEIYQRWSRPAGVAMVTLAPELPGALDAVRALAAAGVVVSAGHTEAGPEVLDAAVGAGVRYVTHLFNAMTPFGHREPGPIGAVLGRPDLVAGLIVDGTHLHPVTVSMAWRALGPGRTSLVTDAVAALGMPDGRYRLGGFEVTVGLDGVRNEQGVLAGSNLTAVQAVRNLAAFTGCTLQEAVGAITAVPAHLLGLPGKVRLAIGSDADLVALTPDLRVAATLVGGQVVHATASAPWLD